MGKCCFFIGHRESGAEIYPMLLSEVERHIVEYGVETVFVGNYGDFDHMAARAVKAAKMTYHTVQLIMVLPYHPAIRAVKIPNGFDGTFYPWGSEQIPRRLAIIKTNQRMVDICDNLIAYAKDSFGGAGQIVEYALRREKRRLIRVSNLAELRGEIQ